MRNAKNIGERIRERRQANALSQTELAKRLNVNQATVSSWETGKVTPGEAQSSKLQEILGGLTQTSEADTEAESQSLVAAWLSRALAKKDLTAGELSAKANLSTQTIYNILSGRAQILTPKQSRR